MPIVFNDNKLLFTEDGKLAMSAACCCCLAEPVEKVVTATYTMVPTNLFSATQSQAAAYAVSPINSISFAGGGETHGPAGRDQTVSWTDAKCPVAVGDLPYVQCTRIKTGDENKHPDCHETASSNQDEQDETVGILKMDFTFTVKVARKGKAEIQFWPSIGTGCCHPRNSSCDADGRIDPKWLWYATEFKYTVNGVETTVQTGWDASTKTYTAAVQPLTITLPIN